MAAESRESGSATVGSIGWEVSTQNEETGRQRNLLVTDFDGTMTQQDFYECVVTQLLTPADLEPWHDYTAGKISHFEALQRIFAKIRTSESELLSVVAAMEFDKGAANSIGQLQSEGWQVTVVSNGCRWYIDRLLARAGIEIEVHSNPGEFSAESGLLLQLPTASPFFSEDMGISKAAVVADAVQSGRYEQVAFAGDGRPDIDAALLVKPELRFARGWLRDELLRRKETFRAFEVWSEIAEMLQGSGS